ncbi:MAG: outer membrane lipoprotein carrier protein LolA [Prevotellaceae bacterium]|nr:outer membrane lipoprotein carrier protein LolA [Prevotellaceae bacterium]
MRDRVIVAFCLAFMLCSLGAGAQELSQEEVVQRISKAAQLTKSLQCEFVQTKEMKLLSDKMVSCGKLYYQQPQKMRWEYTSPYRYTFIVNGSEVTIRKDQRTDKISVNDSKVFKEITRIMMNCVLGKALSDNRSFKTSIASTSSEWVATMVPQNSEMKKMFKAITLYFDKLSSMVSKVVLSEQNGDSTMIEMKEVKTNVPLASTIFTVD